MAIEVTADIKAADRLHQGDILRWDKTDASVWSEYGIVVTADCDLLHKKIRNRVSYVPVVRFESYVSGFWGPDFVERRVSKILEGAVATIRRAYAEIKPHAELNAGAIVEWIDRDPAPQIAAAILQEHAAGKSRLRTEQIIAQAQTALKCQRDLLDPATMTEPYIKRILACFEALYPDGKTEIRVIKDSLNGHCNSLPGDVFFIGAIPGEGDEGYFVLLRHVTQCSLDEISLDPALRPGSAYPLRRVARLQPPFIHAMTQQLAKVFSDIGLPSSRDEKMTACVNKYLA